MKPSDQILALGVQGPFQDIRVGEGKVGRRHRINKLAGIEIELLTLFIIHTRDGFGRSHHVTRGKQVGLFDEIEHNSIVPRIAFKAPVIGIRHNNSLIRLTQRSERGPLPQRNRILPKLRLSLHQRLGVETYLRHVFEELLAQLDRVKSIV